MNDKKIINMKYAVDETGKPVSATVIYDDYTWDNVVENPQQVNKWAAQIAKENSTKDIPNIIYRVPSQDALRRALEADLAKKDKDGNYLLGVGKSNDPVIEEVIEKNKWGKRFLAGLGTAAVVVGAGAGVMHAINNAPDQAIVAQATAEDAAEEKLTTNEISDELKERLQMTDFQREFLDNADATIEQYNALCDKYGLDESFKINIDEYLAAYINYNDLTQEETDQLIPMIINFNKAETMSREYIQSCLQSIVSKFTAMSVVMTDVEDVSVFDGFIQNIEGSLPEYKADQSGLTGEEREKQLANLNNCREIMRKLWTYLVESNNSNQLCGEDFVKFMENTLDGIGIPSGSAFYNMVLNMYAPASVHTANLDERIYAETNNISSYSVSTQDDQHKMSISNGVTARGKEVCGKINSRIEKAYENAKASFEETYKMMEEEGLATKIDKYVNSEYNEEYNELREKYKDIELFNVNAKEKDQKLQDLINDFMHKHGRSWDGNLSNYFNFSSTSNGGQTTTTTETRTEQIPEGQQPIVSSKTEYNDQYDPSKPVLTQDQANDWIAQKEQQVAQGPTTVTNPDGSTTTTVTKENSDGSYTTEEKTTGIPEITTPVDGDIKDEDGNVVISGNKSEPTNNSETEHVKDLIEQAQKEAQESQNANQDVSSQPSNDSSSNTSTSTPVEETPVVEETPSTSGDNTSSAEDNTNVTHEANTDDSSIDVTVGDFVPITDGAIAEYDEKAVENDQVFDENGNFTNEILESTVGSSENTEVMESSSAPVVEETPAPVVEEAPVVAETPAPVVEEAPVVAETPAPVVETTPEPSNVTITVGNDVVTFDTDGNISNVEPAPVEEETAENTKTM